MDRASSIGGQHSLTQTSKVADLERVKGRWRVFTWLGKPFMIDAEKGAETSIFVASSPEIAGITGKYFVKKKEERSSKRSHDQTTAKRLWEVSSKLTGIE